MGDDLAALSTRSIENMLASRLTLLETAIVGSKQRSDVMESIPARLRKLTSDVANIENEVEHLSACCELLETLKPALNRRQGQSGYTLTAIQELSTRREEIKEYVENLKQVQSLASIDLNSPAFHDLIAAEPQILLLQDRLNRLAEEAENQTREVDHLLDVYDKTMLFLSNKCAIWAETLQQLEQKN